MKTKCISALLVFMPFSANATSIFSLNQFTFSQSQTGGATLPDPGLMTVAYNEQGWNLYVSVFIPRYAQDLSRDWVVMPGQEINLEYGFHVNCTAAFTAALALMGTYGTGQTLETFSSSGGDVRLSVDILPGTSGAQIFQGATVELLAEVPEPAMGWAVFAGSVGLLIARAYRGPHKQDRGEDSAHQAAGTAGGVVPSAA